MRVAAIDVGTNTVLLLIAEKLATGELSAVFEKATITRLGEGVDKTRRLSTAAVERTKSCFDDYATEIRRANVDRIAVVATSAMRDAEGGDELGAYVQNLLGVDVEIISGAREAELTFLGAVAGLAEGRYLVIDIGGGSTEVVSGALVGGACRIDFAQSFDIGSVRLTERHQRTDPPLPAERAAMRRDAAAPFEKLPPFPADAIVVGIAGTITTLAAVALDMEPYDGARVHGHELDVETIRTVVSRLATLPLSERVRVRGLDAKRADVIVAGGEIALAFLDAIREPTRSTDATAMNSTDASIDAVAMSSTQRRRSTLVASDRGVRWGLALSLSA